MLVGHDHPGGLLKVDWARAVGISRHLLSSSPVLKRGAVNLDLRGTYQSLIDQGDGYCGDFTEIFVVSAMAAGLRVGTRTFSFDAFGGHGHVWPEIWNRQISCWQLIDVFNNYYFVDTVAIPLSALAFREALLTGSSQLQLKSLDPRAKPGWAIESKAWAYHRRGLPGWYLGWGNNVFTYGRSRFVKMFSNSSNLLKQVGAIANGAYPPIRLLANYKNQTQIQAMWHLHQQLIFLAWLIPLAALVFLICFLGWACRRHKSLSAYSLPSLQHGCH